MAKFKELFADKKQTKKYIKLGIAAAVVVFLAVMPMLASGNTEEPIKASVLTATVENKTIDTQIIGGGQLSSEASISVKIPENVKLTEYLVGNGDTVQEGEPIAKVDKISVMTAITKVQETLDYLAEEITDVSGDEASSTVKARAGGTVKKIYAEVGESVEDVMLEHGALAVLSLDDIMAVQIERQSSLTVGETVCVTLPDGGEVDGRVKSNTNGTLTITVEDDGYAIGTKVSVSTEDGDRLGSGELYIFSSWNATAYSGTVDRILVSEGDSVSVDSSLMRLEDPGHTAEYQRLIDQHQEYEELMQNLFIMYRKGTITAPCDGIITGVDENAAYLLSNNGNGFLNLLSFVSGEKTSGFMAYAVKVTEATEAGISMLLNPEVAYVEDMSSLPDVSTDISAMTETWNYCGDTTVYTQREDGILVESGSARTGDVLLAVGDEEQVYWFVVLNGSKENETVVRTNSTGGSPFVTLLSNTNPSINITNNALNQGIVGQVYNSPLQATDGANVLTGTWAASGLPAGLSIDVNTGDISGIPASAGNYSVAISFTYNESLVVKEFVLTVLEATQTEIYSGYIAKVTEVAEGAMKVMQSAYNYPITDLNNLPVVTVDPDALTEEATYLSPLITEASVALNDYLLIITKQDGTLKHFVKQQAPETGGQTNTPGEGTTGMPSGGTFPSGVTIPSGVSIPSGGGIASGMSGFTVEEDDNLYTLEELTIASVTSQEHMTVSITIDELDITKIYVGQEAVVSVDALGGVRFEAQITQISNSGENEGGNSKFAVEVTLAKSGEMLPGMHASAFITLESRENIPCVPVAALDKNGADSILYTSYDAEKGTLGDPIVVTIGSSDGENVEIIAGLDLGDTCYYEYFDTYVTSDAAEQGGFSFGGMRGR